MSKWTTRPTEGAFYLQFRFRSRCNIICTTCLCATHEHSTLDDIMAMLLRVQVPDMRTMSDETLLMSLAQAPRHEVG